MTDDLKNKTRLAILRMEFLDGIKNTDFYEDTVQGLLKFAKEHPEEVIKYGYVIYYDLSENNIFYAPKLTCEYNTIIIGEVVQNNPDGTYEIESEEFY